MMMIRKFLSELFSDFFAWSLQRQADKLFRKGIKENEKLLKRIDNFIDRAWRNTCATIFYYFDKRVEEDDIDWLNMHNYIQSQKDKD